MNVIARWTIYVCSTCGTVHDDISAICECAPEGTETEPIEVVPVSLHEGAVEDTRGVIEAALALLAQVETPNVTQLRGAERILRDHIGGQ